MSGSAVSLIRPATPPIMMTTISPGSIVSPNNSSSRTPLLIDTTLADPFTVTLGKCEASLVGAEFAFIISVTGGVTVNIDCSPGDVFIGNVECTDTAVRAHKASSGTNTRLQLTAPGVGGTIFLVMVSSTQWLIQGNVDDDAVFSTP